MDTYRLMQLSAFYSIHNLRILKGVLLASGMAAERIDEMRPRWNVSGGRIPSYSNAINRGRNFVP